VKQKITGTGKGRDEQYTVIYIPAGKAEGLLSIEDYETPTYLDNTYVQIGICFE
jgi:hypothetical protein